jgi:hypothetical protein
VLIKKQNKKNNKNSMFGTNKKQLRALILRSIQLILPAYVFSIWAFFTASTKSTLVAVTEVALLVFFTSAIVFRRRIIGLKPVTLRILTSVFLFTLVFQQSLSMVITRAVTATPSVSQTTPAVDTVTTPVVDTTGTTTQIPTTPEIISTVVDTKTVDPKAAPVVDTKSIVSTTPDETPKTDLKTVTPVVTQSAPIADTTPVKTPLVKTGKILPQDASTTTPGLTVVKLFDGSTPFDASAGNGSDTSATNDIVRAGQATGYKFDLSLNDPAAATPTAYNNYTFTTDGLPVGFRWQAVPPLCSGAGSTITGDGLTAATKSILKCNIGTKMTGDVFSVQAAVFTMPIVANNAVLSFNTTVTVDGTTNTVTKPAPQVTATTLPKIDLQKSGAVSVGSKNVGGVPGFVYAHGLGIKLKPGSEVPALPLTLTDDISAINPNAKLLGCDISGAYSAVTGSYPYAPNMPLGNQAIVPTHTVTSPVKVGVFNSGTITCTPQSGNPQIADISISNVATNPITYPDTLYAPGYGAVSPGDNWIGSYYVLVWIPATEFTAGNNYNFTGTNKYNDFNPNGGISGAPNFNDVTLEPGRGLDNNATASNTAITGTENWYTQIYYRPTPGSLEKLDYKFNDGISSATFDGDTTTGSTWGYYIGTNYRSGDGVMAANGLYTSLMPNYYTGVIDIPAGFMSCSTIDTANASIAPLPGHPTRGAFHFSYGQASANSYAKTAVEYGVGGQGGVGTGWTSHSEMQTSTCTDSDSTGGVWYNDITAVPGGIDKITKVRFRVTDTFTVAEQLALMSETGSSIAYSYDTVLLKIKSGAAAGSIVPNYGKFYDPSSTWFTGWSQSIYDSSTGLGYYGDRVTVVGTRVRVAKTINDPITESQTGVAGTTKTFYLSPTSDAMGINPPGQSVNVKIVDTVPAGLSYVVGTSVCIDSLPAIQPTSCQPNVVVNNDGTTTLTWDFGTFTAGSAITKLKYDVTVDTTIADGTTLVNKAVISADNDNSQESWRTDTASAVVLNPSAFAVQKKVLTPLVPIGDPVTFRLITKNTGANAVATSDFIDWLPWNGDSRSPASNFTGKLHFTSITSTGGVPASQIRYTKYNRSTVVLPGELDPQVADTNSAIVWCASLSGGTCPANNSEVTGIRFGTGNLNINEGIQYDLVLTPDADYSDSTGNIITNRFKGRIDGLSLPIESNNVFATVVGGEIGDTVYWDRSVNGLQDTGEPGIPGVTVTLVDPITGNPTDCDPSNIGVQPCTAVTDANGKYLFKNLRFGNYKVVVTAPAGYAQTGDPDATLDNSSVLTVSNSSGPARSNLTGDFGYKGTAKWGDRVWVDTDGDQVQDTFETTNVAAANVDLLFAGFDGVFGTADDVTFTQASTDGNGNYSFVDLPPGVYKSTLDTGSVPGMTVTTPTVVNHTITPGEDYQLADYGVNSNGKIGDTVFMDANGNGTQDTNEPGISGVVVTLKDATGNDIDSDPTTAGVQPTTTTTDSTGKYSFNNLPYGSYTVVVTPPTGYTQSADPDATKDNKTVLAISATSPATQANLTGDFGYQGTAKFGDRVWFDVNGDGIQDISETGISGANVTLVYAGPDGLFGTPDDLIIGTKTTDGTGNYTFDKLAPGNYQATVDPLSVPGATSTTPVTNTHTITTGEDYKAGDFGFQYNGKIGDTVFMDANGNGTQDTNEPGISGVVVTLKDATGNDIDSDPTTAGVQPTTTTTDSTGKYSFNNLPYGSYTVVVTPPTGYTQSADPDATKDNKTVLAISATSPATQANLTGDFGYQGTAKFGDRVWFDVNGDGIQDISETGISGANVTLVYAGPDGLFGTPDDLIIGTKTTDGTGNYTFDKLAPGNYQATVDLASVNGSVTTPISVTTTLTNGQVYTAGDFGFNSAGSIGNQLYVDLNNDGDFDLGEPPLPGVELKLYVDTNGDGLPDGPAIATQTTDATGNYLFKNLLTDDNNVANGAGAKYVVAVTNGTTGLINKLGTPNTNNNGQNPAGYSVTLTPTAVSNQTADFGYVGTAKWGDKVFADLNGNGIQDGTELGLANAIVTLINAGPDGIFGTPDDILYGTKTTDGTGNYTFDNLPAGNYRATVNPNGSTIGTLTTPTAITHNLTTGEDYKLADFGFQAGSIGNQLFIDANLNGKYDSGDLPLANVVVKLYPDANNDGIADGPAISSQTTDANGNYLFTELPNGGYIIKVDSGVPAGMISSPSTITNPIANDESKNPAGFNLSISNGNKQNIAADFGYKYNAKVTIDKKLYKGFDAGAGCATAVEELVIVDKTRTPANITWCFKVTNTGATYLSNLAIADPLLSITLADMTLVASSGITPLAPGASITYYYQKTMDTSLLNNATVTGTPSNSSGVTLPGASNVSAEDPSGARFVFVFDPPIGIKVGTLLGEDVIRWTMTWINTAPIIATGAQIDDEVPVGTTYNGNLSCVPAGSSVTVSCVYEQPSAQYPRGRVLAVANIGPENGSATTAAEANNEFQIIFDVKVAADTTDVSNRASLNWNGFNVQTKDPSTGAASKVVVPRNLSKMIRTGGAYIRNIDMTTVLIALYMASALSWTVRRLKR